MLRILASAPAWGIWKKKTLIYYPWTFDFSSFIYSNMKQVFLKGEKLPNFTMVQGAKFFNLILKINK
jgi:hypothetical protein